MFSMFRDIDTAVAYLCVGLGKHYSGATFRITWSPGRGEQANAIIAPLEHLGPVLARLCRRFPAATVLFDPNRKGLAAGLQCLCPSYIRQVCHIHCRHRDEIPIACLELSHPEAPLAAEPNLELLEQTRQKLHEYRILMRSKKDMHHHASGHRSRHGHHGQ